jgi:hypothetical protein
VQQKMRWLTILEQATNNEGYNYSSGDRDYAYEWPMAVKWGLPVADSPWPNSRLPATGLFLSVFKRDTAWFKQQLAWCYETHSPVSERSKRNGSRPVLLGPRGGVPIDCLVLSRAAGYPEFAEILATYNSFYCGSLIRADTGAREDTVPSFRRRRYEPATRKAISEFL